MMAHAVIILRFSCYFRNCLHPESVTSGIDQSGINQLCSAALFIYIHYSHISAGCFLIQKNGIRPGGPPAVVHDLNPHIELFAGKTELSVCEAFSAACKERISEAFVCHKMDFTRIGAVHLYDAVLDFIPVDLRTAGG